jgi:hypothetical protein
VVNRKTSSNNDTRNRSAFARFGLHNPRHIWQGCALRDPASQTNSPRRRDVAKEDAKKMRRGSSVVGFFDFLLRVCLRAIAPSPLFMTLQERVVAQTVRFVGHDRIGSVQTHRLDRKIL